MRQFTTIRSVFLTFFFASSLLPINADITVAPSSRSGLIQTKQKDESKKQEIVGSSAGESDTATKSEKGDLASSQLKQLKDDAFIHSLPSPTVVEMVRKKDDSIREPKISKLLPASDQMKQEQGSIGNVFNEASENTEKSETNGVQNQKEYEVAATIVDVIVNLDEVQGKHHFSNTDKNSISLSTITEAATMLPNTIELAPEDVQVVELTSRSFSSAVSDGSLWLIEFYSPRCIHCIEFAAVYEEIALHYHVQNYLHTNSNDNGSDAKSRTNEGQQEGNEKTPKKTGSSNRPPRPGSRENKFDNDWDDREDPKSSDDERKKGTNNKKSKQEDKKTKFRPVKVGRINGMEEIALASRFGVRALPQFFVVDGWNVYEYTENYRSKDLIIQFVDGGYKKNGPIPFLTSPMGVVGRIQGTAIRTTHILQDIFEYSSEKLAFSPVFTGMLVFGSMFMLCFVTIVFLAVVIPPRHPQDHFKND